MELLPELKLKQPDVKQKELLSQAAAEWSRLDDARKEVCYSSLG